MPGARLAAMIGSPILVGDDGFSHRCDVGRSTDRVIDVTLPAAADDALGRGPRTGQAARVCIPLTRGLDDSAPKEDALKVFRSADGTASVPTTLQGVGSLRRSRSAAGSGQAPAFLSCWIATGTTPPAPLRNV